MYDALYGLLYEANLAIKVEGMLEDLAQKSAPCGEESE